VCGLFLAIGMSGYGQSTPPPDSSNTTSTAAAAKAPAQAAATETKAAPAVKPSARPEQAGRIGVGVKMSMLGAGIEAAARVTHHTNFRAGFNMMQYSRTFHNDTNTYGGQLNFKTVEAHYDLFPFAGSFHVSAGMLAYIGDPLTATISTESFKLNGTTYYSPNYPAPITGTGKIDFDSVSPTVTLGFGNLVPRRRSKHFSVPFEIGVAFQGPPKATLNLPAELCTNISGPDTGCISGSSLQANVFAEQNKLNSDMKLFKEYPIISIGFGYKF
jgi:hypothetical protein